MAGAQSRAYATWEGDLFNGNGKVKVESGAIQEQPITWASRTQRTEGKTSPEELIAAAHAGCYAMALSNTLAKQGTPPKRLEISAVATFEKVGEGFKITTMDLDVRAAVPGLDQQNFQEAAKKGEQGCPVSNALRNNVEIRLKASLIPE
jgi:osmotically inducible protein OsmC